MPTTLDSTVITTAQQELLRYMIQQAIVDRLGRAMTAGEITTMEYWLTWIEAWPKEDKQ